MSGKLQLEQHQHGGLPFSSSTNVTQFEKTVNLCTIILLQLQTIGKMRKFNTIILHMNFLPWYSVNERSNQQTLDIIMFAYP